MKKYFFILSGLFLFAFTVRAQVTLVNYDFNSGSSYITLAPALASGITSTLTCTETFATFTGTATGGSAFTTNSTAGSAIAMSNSSGTNTRYWTFQFGGASLSSYLDYKLYFQAQRSGTGAQTITVQYSTDGTTYNTFASNTMSPGNGSFVQTVIDLTSISAIELQSTFYIRLFASGASGTGTLRLDNFQLQGVLSSSNTITTGSSVTGSPFNINCSAGASGSVSFTSTGTFTAGNVYTAQLSNASGSFASPVSIGTLSSTANSGSVNFTIPAGTASGSGYLIRVVSSTPSVTGTSSSAFTINLSCPELQLQQPVSTNQACGFSYSYGTQNVGSNTDMVLTIVNTGTANLTVSSLNLSGSGFTLVSPPATPFSIAPSASQNLTIRFTPGSGGAFSGVLTINNDDSDEGTCTVSLGGTGFVPCGDLFFSEYVEGSGNNKYLEIYNPTGSPVSLANYEVRLYTNGSSTPSNTHTLSGTLAAYSTIVLANSGASVYAGATTTSVAVNFNGDDALELYKISTASSIDIFGEIGVDPGASWTVSGNTTVDRTLVRKSTVQSGNTLNTPGFPTLGTEWDQYTTDNVSHLGAHSSSCDPYTITTGVVSGSPFNIDCSTSASGSVAFTSTGTFTAGNVYTAQLSDASGSFSAPVTIGTLSSTANSGSISITIPAGTASGTGYRIRVVSNTPAVTGSLSSAITINLASCSITTGSVTGGPFVIDCSTTDNGTVAFTSVATFLPGNVFTAELSDASGSFSAPVNIGTLTSTSNSGTINITIPAGLSGGTGYRIRVVSSTPAITGSSSSPVTINSTCGPAGLTPGYLAILAFNTDIGDGNGTDEVSFVSFTDITPGTVIDITDNAYQKCGTTNGWGISEGWIRLTRTGSILPAGEVVTFRVTYGVPSVIAPDANWTCSQPQPSGQGLFDMNANGEQIFFMTGGNIGGPASTTPTSDAGTYSGIFLYGFNTKGNVWTPVCANSAGGGTQNSDKPLNFDCFLTWPTSQADQNKYTGPLTPATQRDWIDRIGNSANWTGYANNTAYNAGPDYINFNGPLLGRTIIINTGGFSAGKWVGTTNTDWFECSNWEAMRVPDITTDVVIDQSAVNHCVVGVTPTGSAACNNLSLSSNSASNINLTIQNADTLTCAGNITVQKTAGSGIVNLNILNTSRLVCNDLSLTGTSAGSTNARFNNQVNTTTVFVNGSFTLNNGGMLDMSNGVNYGMMYLKGNYTNNGLETDFNQANSVIYFDGAGNQNINAGGFTEVFGNIIINKSSGDLALNTPVNIENSITYTSGKLLTDNTNLVNFMDNATATGMSNSSFTDGPVRKTGDDIFTFPVGAGSDYQPASISAPGSVTDHFTAQYFHTDPGPTYNDNLKDPTIDHISNCEYWIINRTNGSSNVTVRLSWDANSCGVTNLSELLVARWDGAMWKDHGNGGTTGNTTAGTIVTSGNVTSFSPFTLASSTVQNPLPVELVSFEGKCNNGEVELDWITVSEINNSHFNIERSDDGVDYTLIASVQGAGNSNQQLSYSYTDAEKQTRDLYYRLTQVDYNGDTETFGPVYINCISDATTSGIGAYIAYVSGSQIALNVFSQATTGDLVVQLYDNLGRNLSVWKQQVVKGQNLLYLNAGYLSAGIYTIRLYTPDMQESLKLMIR